MSYDPAPRWTQNIIIPSKYEIRCPGCGKMDPNAEELLTVLKGPGVYEVQHVPPAIIGTCCNADCEQCDEAFVVELKAVISVVNTPRDTLVKHWVIAGEHAWVMVIAPDLESVFKIALSYGLALKDFNAIGLASAREINEYKDSGCMPLSLGGPNEEL